VNQTHSIYIFLQNQKGANTNFLWGHLFWY